MLEIASEDSVANVCLPLPSREYLADGRRQRESERVKTKQQWLGPGGEGGLEGGHSPGGPAQHSSHCGTWSTRSDVMTIGVDYAFLEVGVSVDAVIIKGETVEPQAGRGTRVAVCR